MKRLFAAFLLSTPMWAAELGKLQGMVRDSSGLMMPVALITCIQDETGFRFSARTNPRGEYSMALPTGHYKVLASQPGFQVEMRIGIFVQPSAATQLDFRLAPESLSQRTVVSDSISPLDPVFDPGDGAVVIRPDSIEGLPQNDRTVTGLMQLTPGMLTTPSSGGEPGQISSLGARSNTNRYSVDGISANNAVSGGGWPSVLPGARLPEMTAFGTTHALAPMDAIAQVRIAPEGLMPEVGRAPGGTIAIDTKAGTNRFHGSFFYADRPSGLGANDWFANRYALTSTAPSLSDAGGSFGGPLRRDHMFFFVAAERLGLRQDYSWITTVPSIALRALAPQNQQALLDLFPLPNLPPLPGSFGIGELVGSSVRPGGLWTGNVRLDEVLSTRTQVFFRANLAPSWSESGLTQIDHSDYQSSVAQLSLTQVFSSLIADTQIGFNRTLAVSQWDLASTGAFYSEYPSFPAEFATVSIGGAGSVESGVSGHTSQDQLSASESVRRVTGHHDIRAGAEYLQLRPIRGGPSSNWDVAFSSPTNLFFAPAAPVWVTYSAIQANSSRMNQVSGYLQDTWKLSAALTVTAGLRTLAMPAPSAARWSNLFAVDELASGVSFNPIAAGAPLWHGNLFSFDPSASVAWRLAHNGASVLRASWASFHDGDFAVATDQLNGAPYLSLRSSEGSQYIQWGEPLFPVQMGYGVASNLRIPIYRRWDVTLQQSFSHAGSLALSYSGMSGDGLLRRDTYFNNALTTTATGIGQLSYATNDGASIYNAFHAVYKRTLARGLQANASYSWSHSIDLGSSDSLLYLYTPGSAASDRGDSDFDVRHTLNLNASYTIRDRWTIGTYTYIRSGFPIDVLQSETLDGSAISNYRPDVVPGEPIWISDPSVPGGLRLNPAAFSLINGNTGNLGRNSIRGFGAWQSDVAVERTLHIAGAFRVSFRVEGYNVFNHAQFADPVRYLSSPLFGTPESALNLMMGAGTPVSGQAPMFQMGGPRSLQLSLRMGF